MSETEQAHLGRALDGTALDIVAITAKRRAAKARDIEGVAERLCASAIHLFSERGFDDVTVGDIARNADLTARTFFRYYPAKETVVIDVSDAMNRRLLELVQTAPLDDRPITALGQVLRGWLTEYEELALALSALTASSAALTSAMLLAMTEWEERVAEALCHRLTELDKRQSQTWAGTMFLLMRLSTYTAAADGGRIGDLCDEFTSRIESMIEG